MHINHKKDYKLLSFLNTILPKTNLIKKVTFSIFIA